METARAYCGKPVVISPVTFRPRFNPNATAKDGLLAAECDPRQTTGFGAAWTLGTLGRLATSADVHSITFYETAGLRGVMDSEGGPFPMWYVFAALRGWDLVCECESTEPLEVDGLALTRGDGAKRLLLAGFGREKQRVSIEHAGSGVAPARALTARGWASETKLRAAGSIFEVEVPSENALLMDWAGGAE